jgi:hypothetical protein
MNADSQPPCTSLASRLANVFVVPGEVFEEVKASPHHTANWLVPMLLACAVGLASAITLFSTESLARQMHEGPEKAIQQQIDSGKIPRAQGESTMNAVALLIKVSAYVHAVVGAVVWPFILAVVVWLLGKFVFKAEFAYLKALEVSGLAAMIGVLNKVVSLLLALGMGNLFATPSPALLIRAFDVGNFLHLAAASCNVLTIWHVGVVAAGLAKMSGVSWAKAAGWLYALWVVAVSGSLLLGWAATQLRGALPH